MNTITLSSPAKINLRLEILGKRPDGYHDIRTIFQKVSLFDEITLTVVPRPGITITVDEPSIPADSSNLAYKAASGFFETRPFSRGLAIHIKKRIPSGAGLGGGSSNAATTLIGLNSLLEAGMPDGQLHNLAVSLGADVPFFMSAASTALGTGIGEKLTPINLHRKLWCILISPDFSISTAWAYTTFSKHNILTNNKKNIIIDDSIFDIKHVVSLLCNDFENTVIPEYPEIEQLKNDLAQAGAAGTLLSGSGSSVFGVFPSHEAASNAMNTLREKAGYTTHIVHSL